MAEFLGVTERHYRLCESGKVDLPTSKLIALADYFDVSLDYLVGRSDDPRFSLFCGNNVTKEQREWITESLNEARSNGYIVPKEIPNLNVFDFLRLLFEMNSEKIAGVCILMDKIQELEDAVGTTEYMNLFWRFARYTQNIRPLILPVLPDLSSYKTKFSEENTDVKTKEDSDADR